MMDAPFWFKTSIILVVAVRISFGSQMALFRNSPPAPGQVGVNHALGVTGLESFVRRK